MYPFLISLFLSTPVTNYYSISSGKQKRRKNQVLFPLSPPYLVKSGKKNRNQMDQLGNLAHISRASLENFSLENIQSQLRSAKNKLSAIRPPQEFFNVRSISKPADFSDLQSRISYNLGYYSTNYALIVGSLSVYALLTNLLLLFVILFLFLGFMVISKLEGQPLVTPFGSFNTSQLYTGLLCVAVPLGFLASPVSTMLWLIGASVMSVFTHAAFMEKPIETVFDEEQV